MKHYISLQELEKRIVDIYHEKNYHPSLLDAVMSLGNDHFSQTGDEPNQILQITENPNGTLLNQLMGCSEEAFLKDYRKLCMEFDFAHIDGKTGDNHSWSKGYPSDVFIGFVFYKESHRMHAEKNEFEMN